MISSPLSWDAQEKKGMPLRGDLVLEGGSFLHNVAVSNFLFIWRCIFFFFILTNQGGNSRSDIQKWQVSELQWGVYTTANMGKEKTKVWRRCL